MNCGKIAVYPGTFDPLTNGHTALINRGLGVFDMVVVAVAEDTPKQTFFSVEERVELTKLAFVNDKRVQVVSFSGLLIHFMLENHYTTILRGLRAMSDFEYEFQMALVNRSFAESIQTVFMVTEEKYLYVSSTLVREVGRLKGDISTFVPSTIYNQIINKLQS